MTIHKDWFGVDITKRAARVRSHPLGHILKEALSNSLDAGAPTIAIACKRAARAKRDYDSRMWGGNETLNRKEGRDE